MPLPPLPPIDTIEGLLVEVGIDSLISREVEKVGIGRLRQAAKIPDEIRTLSRKLVRGELEPSIGLRDFNWRKAVMELAAGWDPEQIIDMLRSFPAEYRAAASALIIKSVKLIKELASGLPLTRYQTLSGSKNLIPADAHIFKFASVLEVIRDPLIVPAHGRRGALEAPGERGTGDLSDHLGGHRRGAVPGHVRGQGEQKVLRAAATRGVRGPQLDGQVARRGARAAAVPEERRGDE